MPTPDRFHPDTFRGDGFHEECGVVGVYGHPEAATLAYLSLYALQHRGQESAGIVASNGEALIAHRGMGLVADIFNQDILARLEGRLAIGHNRYSTSGSTVLKNCQPFVVEWAQGALAIAHNGNLVNAEALRERLETRGSIFQSTSDTEVIIHLIAASPATTLVGRIVDALAQVRGAYSLVFLTETQVIAARDPGGFRPLVLGRVGDAVVVTSETCALDLVDATYEREVEPGEIVVIDERGVSSLRPFPPASRHHCVFEYVYFARPDSQVFGRNVYEVRKELGRQLARESAVPADIVIPVPDSGVPAAIGYAEEARLPFEMGLIRNHYVGRTFIEPTSSIRHFGVKVKLNALREVLAGKRVVVVDDSIVRGTTSRKLVHMLRQAGAREVHMRISSPPTTHPCFYGIDTPTREELIASTHSVAETREYVGADSLAYLSLAGLYAFTGGRREGFCDACFSGDYPVPLDDEHRGVRQLHLFEARERPEHR
ncbi:MAG TPA: amidophosphoribosyltransferase [Candidatus Binatia bacterium]|nr:amidophosphoribosyltransferase [Candidatus Binatia bacterium]